MSIPIAVVGAGGFGREVLDIIEAINTKSQSRGADQFRLVGVFAEPAPTDDKLEAYAADYLGGVSHLRSLDDDVEYVVAIGDSKVRRRIVEEMTPRKAATLVHPSATMGRSVVIGAGTVICAGVRLTNHIVVGRHVHVNLNSTIGHDSHIGDFATLSPLVAVSGNVDVSEAAFLGTGATVNPGVGIGFEASVGSGAVVVRDVDAATEVVGVPARPR